jgi:hypothetical protein
MCCASFHTPGRCHRAGRYRAFGPSSLLPIRITNH